jgi:hypothetical protein
MEEMPQAKSVSVQNGKARVWSIVDQENDTLPCFYSELDVQRMMKATVGLKPPGLCAT